MSNRDTRSRTRKTPPEPPSPPIVGHTYQFLRRDPLDWFTELNEAYGPVVQLRVAGQRLILPTEPDDIERVLLTNSENYEKGGFQKMVTRSLLGNGLVIAEGDEWRAKRQGIEPVFHPKRMAEYQSVITSHTQSTIERISSGETVDLEQEMKHLTLNIIVDALFGVDLSTEDWDLEPAFKRILTHFERISQTYLYLPEWIPTPENRAYRSAISTLDSAVEDLIAAHRAGDIDGPTVLNYLLESDEDWDTKDLRDEIVTLLLAGHETTALMLTFTGDLLARHPDVQETVAREVREKPLSYFFGYNDEYSELDKVIQESLRLYPPVYGVFRQPIEDDQLSGFHVPSGSIIALNQWVAHRDSRWYQSPTQFNPGRWSKEFEKSVPTGAYFPFAAGPRRCVGERFARLEAKLILINVLREFRLTKSVDESLDVIPSLTTQPAETVSVTFRDR
ncbi:cytochrome P450 [Haloferax sp. KTX1]|uniref:cytochrome P450 n=1 Tax=Haloferax sp. KTX1 TaxID=2600597 RepID=UPI0011DDE32E|nr:cytochrome P450 [Haloferax sp. KTX1]